MAMYEVTIEDKATYTIEADDRESAVELAENFFNDRDHDVTTVELPEVDEESDMAKELLEAFKAFNKAVNEIIEKI